MSIDVLNKLNISEKSILFFYSLEPHDVLEDGVQYVVVDNKKNFIEIGGGSIISKYCFPFPITKVERISIYHSYQPKFKYYLIQFNKFIIILKKSNNLLSFVDRINDVRDFHVADYYDTGRPQVVVNLLNKDLPLVTDFSETSNEHKVTFESENRVLYGLNLTITSQLQSLNVRIKEAENQLYEKGRLVSSLTGDFFQQSGKSDFPCNGYLLDLSNATMAKCDALSVGASWVRSYQGKWIIGFPVSNLQERTISKIKVFILSQDVHIEKTVLFVPKVKTLEGSEFRIAQCLMGHKMGIVIAVIREPLMTGPQISFTCNAAFCHGGEDKLYQVYLGEISVTSQEILSNKLAPFRTSKSFRDIIACLSVSLRTELYLKDQDSKQLFVNNLKDNYGFIPVTDRYTVNIMENSVFTGVLISVESNRFGCAVEFHTKDSRQLTLLLQCLHKYQFEEPFFLPRPESQLEHFHSCIKDELKAVQNVIAGNIGTSSAQASSVQETGPLQALRSLENDTRKSC